MTGLNISITTVLRYIKVRFIFIGILMMVGVLILPYWLPYSPNYEPTYSIYSDQEYGHSNLLPRLENYEVSRSHNFDTDAHRSNDLIIITKPQLDLDDQKVHEIMDAYFEGTKLLIIGSVGLEQFYESFEFGLNAVPQEEGRIFDEFENGGDLVYPALNGYDLTNIYGVVPTYLEYSGYGEISGDYTSIQTEPTSGLAGCFNHENPCLGIQTVGVIYDDFGLIGDEWMFRNTFTDAFPNNINLFLNVIEDLIGTSGSILFEESFLEWAPVNSEGVENFIEVRLEPSLIAILIFALGLLIPFMVGVQANIFSTTQKRRDTENFNNLERRLDFVHIEKLPSAPLNIMEKVLMEERLKYEIRGKYYQQYAARRLLDFIEDNNLQGDIPADLYGQLDMLSIDLYSDISSWRVLEMVYQILLSKQSEN